MDEIEDRILDAWEQVKPRLSEDPAELNRRLARRNSRSLSRPPRAWCLAIRASDRRLAEYVGVASNSCSRRACSALDAPETTANTAAKAAGYTHTPSPTDHGPLTTDHSVFLDFHLLDDLCRPVKIPWGGDTWDEVAKKLGVGFKGLHHARISGKFRTDYVAGLCGRVGPPVPMLACDESLDPNARGFAQADPAWGWTGSFIPKRIPADFEQCLTRVPVHHASVARGRYDDTVHPEVRDSPTSTVRQRLPPPPPDHVWYKWSKSGVYLGNDPKYWRKSPSDPGKPPPAEALVKKRRRRKRRERLMRGSLVFRGWMWICPRCQKKVRTVYLPLCSMNLLADEIDDVKDEGRRMKDEKMQEERFGANALPSSFIIHPSTFACYSCHRVRSLSRIDAKNSWNELIAYLTGGLLYGREVQRPDWFGRDARRKREFRPRANRLAPRRQQVLRRMLNGWTIMQIAKDLKMCKQQVCDCIRKLCRQENVKNRRELAAKLGSPHFQPMDSDRKSRKELEPQMNTDERR